MLNFCRQMCFLNVLTRLCQATILFLVATNLCYASENGKIDQLLRLVKKNSREFRVSQYEAEADLTSKSKQDLIFKTKGFAKSNYSNQKLPPTSPFSNESSSSFEHGVGVQKLWSSGIQSQLNYTLSDATNTLRDGTENQFLNPKLEVVLSTNLFQDVLGKRYKHLKDEVANSVKAIEVNKKVSQKRILANSLLSFATLLENKEERELQAKLCRTTKTQSNKLARKKRRQSISSRDYYSSARELVNCQIRVEELDKLYTKNSKEFESKYNISLDLIADAGPSLIFEELKSEYSRFSAEDAAGVGIGQIDELVYLEGLLQSSQAKQLRLKALAKPDVALELRAGASGLDSSLGESHKEITELKYPFMSVGVNVDLPWGNRSAKVDLQENSLRSRVIQEKIEISKTQLAERLSTLRQTLQQDFEIYEKYLKSVRYSKQILGEGQKDFDNGRIDFFALTEYNKSLITNQKNLAAFRIQLVLRMVEYFDFHHYFDKYF